MWPVLRSFWQEMGLSLVVGPARRQRDGDRLGREPRQDPAGRDSRHHDRQGLRFGLSTGERDKFRTRVERSSRPAATCSSRCAAWSRCTPDAEDADQWQLRRPTHTSKLKCFGRLQKLAAKTAGAMPAAAAVAGRQCSGTAGTAGQDAQRRSDADVASRRRLRPRLAPRRPGADRGGFTVEDRDRPRASTVRYVDPAQAGKGGIPTSPSCSGSIEHDRPGGCYRVAIKSTGRAHQSGHRPRQPGQAPENGEAAQRILNLFLGDLEVTRPGPRCPDGLPGVFSGPGRLARD